MRFSSVGGINIAFRNTFFEYADLIILSTSRVDEGRPIFEDASSPLRTPDVRISRIRRSHVLFMKGIRGQRLRLSWITPNLW